MLIYGRSKAHGETDWKRRLGYQLFGEMHIPGRLRAWHLIQELKRLDCWSDRPLRVLDAGGAEGAFAYYIAQRFPQWTVVLADNEEAALERARRIREALKLENLETRLVDLREMGTDERYDLVICSDVLEHIVEDDLVVQQLGAVLEPGGSVVMTSPSVPQPKHLALVERREKAIGFDMSDYGHVRQGYSRERMVEIIEQAGLEVDRVRFTFGRFGTLMFDLFFITGDSRPNPLVFAAMLPLYMLLSALDLVLPSEHGAAILGVGRKP